MEQLLSAKEMAQVLQISTWSMRALVRGGRVHAYRIGDGPRAEMRFDKHEVLFSLAGEAAGGRSTPRVWLVEACADILETRAADMSVSVADRKNARQGALGLRSGSLPLETVLADIGYTTEQVG